MSVAYPRQSILLSYWYHKNTDLDAVLGPLFEGLPRPDVFADCGAFSAHALGGEVNIHEYAAWCKRWSHWLTVYSSLDVKGSVAQTRANQQTLEDKGLQPLPVWHVGEPLSELERYIEEYRYIALGGIAKEALGQSERKMGQFLVRAFKMARDETGVVRSVFHGFGVTRWQLLKDFPFYSGDSSSWCSSYRYGLVSVFDPTTASWIRVQLGSRTWAKHGALVRKYGYQPSDFMQQYGSERRKVAGIASLSVTASQEYLRRRHGRVELPDRPGPMLSQGYGPKVYQVNANVDGLQLSAGEFKDKWPGIGVIL